MVKSPIFQLEIKLLLTEEREREVSTTTGSSCLGRDRGGPHPIAASIQDWCFCHRRYESKAVLLILRGMDQSLLNRHGVFQGRRHIEGNDPVAESFL
jgi:hypothetical protein